MKILNASQLSDWDTATINSQKISSLSLMESASKAVATWIEHNFPTESSFTIICGNGNNGGDGFAIARMLRDKFHEIEVHYLSFSSKRSGDNLINLEKLKKHDDIKLVEIDKSINLKIPSNAIIIDAIFGYGIKGLVKSPISDIIENINSSNNPVISIDLPSGLVLDAPTKGAYVSADWICSFQCPKMAFFMDSDQSKLNNIEILDIGLDKIWKASSPFIYYINKDYIKPIFKKRHRFSHKGTYGHVELFCGSHGMYGAAILTSKAAIKSGCGLVSIDSPKTGFAILQSTVPEAMVRENLGAHYIKEIKPKDKATIAIGCGIGKSVDTTKALIKFLSEYKAPLVLDADALNIIAENKDALKLIPEDSIITPHPGEFERLFGKTENDWERLDLQTTMSKKYKINIVLKTAFTKITDRQGQVYVNSTGNPGMATAGSGDVLTGITASLLAQKYTPIQSAILGCYIHGLAGDLAAKDVSQASLTAGDIINYLSKAFLKFEA